MSGNTNNIGLVINSVSPLSTLNGGTGTSNTFTLGSIPYIDSGSLFSESNSSLFLDTTNFNLYLGANSSTQTFQSAGRLVSYGTQNTNLNSITQYTNADGYPNLQIMGYNHGNNAISFDSYYTTSWLSSNLNSNFQIAHNSNQLQINYASGVAQGSGITWNNALYVDTSGVTHVASLDADVINFPDLDPNGIVTTDSSSNLVAVSSPNTYTPTIGDGTNNFITTTQTQGVYYNIGPLYFVTGLVRWINKGSANASSPILISLPATIGSSIFSVGGSIGSCSGITFPADNFLCISGSSSNYLTMTSEDATGTGAASILVSNCLSIGALIFTVFYWNN